MYGLEPILETMLNVSIVIPAWNEQERINDCLLNATRQTVMPHEVIVVDNRSTDSTVAVVEQFMKDHPEAPVKLLHQDDEQGLIPTRDYGLNHATGDILGRFDADCMIRPDWVEVVSGIFTEDPADEVCQDKADVMHEDIDISLHLLGKDLKTVYCPRMIAGISARRMDTSPASFLNYMRRFKNTFNAHPQHYRKHKPEILITALYPVMHLLYPVWQKVLNTADINPAEAAWINEQMELAEQEGHELYDDTPTDEEWSEKHEE